MRHFPQTVLLYNPACSKCRAASLLLTERGVEFLTREYLKDPLSRDELEELQRLLGAHPREWVRPGGAEWDQSGLTPSSEAGDILDAIAEHPALLQRPILAHDGRALIGRPPTALLELLED